MKSSIERYFATYPARGQGGFSRLTRYGERERIRQVQMWLPDTTGLTILDAGCGDGVALSNLLDGPPSRIKLEDCVAQWTDAAVQRLSPMADVVESAVVDVKDSSDRNTYDLVFALGVFDYEEDWSTLFRTLLSRSKGMLLADFPKRGTWHFNLRTIWLKRHGLHLHAGDRLEVETLLGQSGGWWELAELPLQWIARVSRSRPR